MRQLDVSFLCLSHSSMEGYFYTTRPKSKALCRVALKTNYKRNYGKLDKMLRLKDRLGGE